MEPTTRHSLLLQLRDRANQPAWGEFVEIYEPLIYRLARARGLQDADACDLCQEVFRAVASAIERFDLDPAKGRFRAWLSRIARNLLINLQASQRRQIRGSGSTSVQELLEAQPVDESQAEAAFALELQQRAFRWAASKVQNEFAESTWQAFWKTGVENLPVAQAAVELGLSPGAVYIARSRVLARLRERVEQWTDPGPRVLEGSEHGHAPPNL